jgi:hypothetical protein
MMAGYTLEVLPPIGLIEIDDGETLRLVEVPGQVLEILELGSLVVNVSGESPRYLLYTQMAAQTVWMVSHQFGRRPAVTVTDLSGEEITPKIEHLDDNVVMITHALPENGRVHFNA